MNAQENNNTKKIGCDSMYIFFCQNIAGNFFDKFEWKKSTTTKKFDRKISLNRRIPHESNPYFFLTFPAVLQNPNNFFPI